MSILILQTFYYILIVTYFKVFIQCQLIYRREENNVSIFWAPGTRFMGGKVGNDDFQVFHRDVHLTVTQKGFELLSESNRILSES